MLTFLTVLNGVETHVLFFSGVVQTQDLTMSGHDYLLSKHIFCVVFVKHQSLLYTSDKSTPCALFCLIF